MNKTFLDRRKNDLVLATERQIDEAIKVVADAINKQQEGEELLVLCIMTGGLLFCAELIKHLKVPLQLDYIHVTRYQEELSGNTLKWLKKNDKSLNGKNVLIVDDICDEGITLQAIVDYCKEQAAAKVYTAVLVEKKIKRKITITVDFVALQLPDAYLYGYGMDYKGYFRNVPEIKAVKIRKKEESLLAC